MLVPETAAAETDLSRVRALRTLAIVLASVAGFGWLFGAARLLRADGSVSVTLPRREQPPNVEHNVASYRFGPTLRASSYYRDPTSHHHPMFLVDGRYLATLVEKWASAPRDAWPWVEVLWREPRDISRVVIRHAGARETRSMTLRNYRLRCLAADAPGPWLSVRDNRLATAEHALSCQAARGLRAEWTLNAQDDLARVYELEVWGR